MHACMTYSVQYKWVYSKTEIKVCNIKQDHIFHDLPLIQYEVRLCVPQCLCYVWADGGGHGVPGLAGEKPHGDGNCGSAQGYQVPVK